MYKIKFPDVYASEIAGFLNEELRGKDFIVKFPCSRKNFKEESFFYLLDTDDFPREKLDKSKNVLVMTNQKADINNEAISFLFVKSPKSAFMKIINEFYIEFDPVKIADSARVNKNAKISRGVMIGENCVIGSEVFIGNNTIILNNVVISGSVKIGDNCLIKNNTTIGSEGFDFTYDEDRRLIHCPQIGGIVIGNNVWIGANSSIETSTFDSTIIEDNVKIDDLVQIGGTSVIGKGTIITAGTIVNRDVSIGRNCLLSPNACIRESITLGDNITIGMGAVVVKDLPEDGVYIGNPAKFLRKKNPKKEVF